MASNISSTPLGEVKETLSEFEWTIPNFLSLSKKIYSSSSVSFAGASWDFVIYPKGVSDVSDGYISIFLGRADSFTPITLKVSFAIKNSDGKKDRGRNGTAHCMRWDIYASYRWISRDELLKRASELLPSNVLTVLCSLEHLEATEDAHGAATSLCTYCKNTLDADSVSSHEKKCTERPIKCPECSEVVLLQDWYGHECQVARKEGDTATSLSFYCKNTFDAESVLNHEKKCTERPIKCPECSEVVLLQDWYGHAHECQTARTEGEGALIRDLKKMMSDGKNHDLILKIGDKEIRAHRDILSSRSHVFESMLNHDMKEKNSGIINVPDCDPEAMKFFLLYIYTGKVETDQSHMLGLYYIADKHDMQCLKKECHNFIKKSLSHTNICDVIQLAINHSDSGLLDFATEYFIKNALDITVTVEWQSFLKDNTTLGNELIIKSFQKLKVVKS